jgi:small-conductance mechanosensitive channel
VFPVNCHFTNTPSALSIRHITTASLIKKQLQYANRYDVSKLYKIYIGLHVILYIKLIIIIIIIIIISFMRGIHTCTPETSHVSTVYSVAAMPRVLLMVHTTLSSILNSLCFYISTFRSMCAVPNIAVFCSSLTSCFSGMLLKYFLKDFELLSSPLCTVFTLIYLKQTMFLGYTVSQLFYAYC